MKFENQTFERQEVILDFNQFFGCMFIQCQIVFLGYGLTSLVNCRFDDCAFPIGGPGANYVYYLRNLYAAGGDSQKLAEEVISIIRGEFDPFQQTTQEQTHDSPSSNT